MKRHQGTVDHDMWSGPPRHRNPVIRFLRKVLRRPAETVKEAHERWLASDPEYRAGHLESKRRSRRKGRPT